MTHTKVRLIGENGEAGDGVILLCSPNRDSLMVGLTDGFLTRSGGLYVDMMPLLRTDGVYRELVSGEAIDVHWVDP